MPDPAPDAAPHDGPATTLTVDLDAVVANYRLIADQAPSAATAAVVKADAYGLGADPVARALSAAGCQTFFVALPGEGERLRRTLPAARIAVLNGPSPDDLAVILDNRLVPVLNTLEQLDLFAANAPDGAEAMLHVDTGMTRLGLSAHQVDAIAGGLAARLGKVRITALLSHLACADDPANPQNQQQLDRFTAVRAQLKPALGTIPASLAGSSGSFLGPQYHGQLLRPGAALYGISPLINAPNQMRQVIEFTAKIIQVRDIDRVMTVGYGATHEATRGGRIATLSAGYADGFPRSLGNKGHGFVKGDNFVAGHRVPIVGRVSMDLTTLDVTAVPSVRPGDHVELIGPNLSVDEVAASAGTIGYEILTNIGRRTPRTYRGGVQ